MNLAAYLPSRLTRNALNVGAKNQQRMSSHVNFDLLERTALGLWKKLLVHQSAENTNNSVGQEGASCAEVFVHNRKAIGEQK